MTQENRLSPHFYAVLTFVFFGLMNVCVKALDGTVPLSLIVLSRFVIGLLVFMPIAQYKGGLFKNFQTKHPGLHGLRALVATAAMGCSFYAVTQMPLADANALGQIYPFMLLLISVPLLGEKTDPRQFFACALGLSGVLLIARPHGEAALVPTCLVIAAAILSACGDLLMRRIARQDDGLTIVLWFFGLTSLVAAFWWISMRSEVFLTLQQFFLLLGVGLLGSLSQLFITQAFKYLPAGTMGPYSYLGTFLSIVYGWVFFSEIPTLWMMAGLALIIIGVQWNYFVSRALKRRSR